jgi:hypothetical protein
VGIFVLWYNLGVGNELSLVVWLEWMVLIMCLGNVVNWGFEYSLGEG